MRRWVGILWTTLACLVAAAGQDDQALKAISIDLLTSETNVEADGGFVQTIHTEIRALNDAGAMSIGRIDVPFVPSMQTLDIVEAYTRKVDGTKIPVDTSTIYEQMASDQAQMLTDRRVKAILFPHFAGGDTAVYTVRIVATKPYFAGAFFYGSVFPRSSPLKEVRQTVTAPKSMGLRGETHEVKLEHTVRGDRDVFTLHYSSPGTGDEDLPAVSPIDSIPRVFLSSFGSYADLGRAFAGGSASKAAVTPRVQALADQIVGAAADRKEQARLITNWVTTRIRYVAVELGQGSLIPHDADSVLANGYGDCKDHDVLLQALLKAKGIAATSVLLNLGNSYSLTEAPTFAQLNHVITYLPEFKLFLDSSNAFAPFGTLSFEAYGKPAVFASVENASLGMTPTLPPGMAYQKTVTESKLAANGTLSGVTTTTARGPTAITLRGVGMMVQAGGQNAVKMLLGMRGMGDGTGSFDVGSPFERSDDYAVTGKFSTPGWDDAAGGKDWFVMPGGSRVLGLSGDGLLGSLSADKKKDGEAIPCFSGRDEEDLSLTAPEGMRFLPPPADARIEGDNFTFTAHWTLKGNTMSVHREFVSRIDAPFCTGAVHKANAAALRKVSDHYDQTKIKLVRVGVIPGLKIVDIKATGLGSGSPLETAMAYMQKGMYDEAAAAYTAILRTKPDDATAQVGQCRAMARSAVPEDAVAICGKLIEKQSLSGTLRLSRGIAYFQIGKFKEALHDFEVAARTFPSNAEYRYACGAAKLKLGDKTGQADIDAAVKIDSGIAKTMKKQKVEI